MKIVLKYILLLFIAFLAFKCETYDNAIIYHRNFVSGTHPLLRFDGYYTDTLGPVGECHYKWYENIKPIFIYANGSTFSANNYFLSDPNNIDKEKMKTLVGSWGNYLIEADTIQLEKFQKIGNNYERIILKGIISKNQIHWIERKEHNDKFKAIDYSVLFMSNSQKPDSTLNFTRTKKKYNKY